MNWKTVTRRATVVVSLVAAYVAGHCYPRPLNYALSCGPEALNPMIVKRRRQPAFIGADSDEEDDINSIVQTKNEAYYAWLHEKMHE